MAAAGLAALPVLRAVALGLAAAFTPAGAAAFAAWVFAAAVFGPVLFVAEAGFAAGALPAVTGPFDAAGFGAVAAAVFAVVLRAAPDLSVAAVFVVLANLSSLVKGWPAAVRAGLHVLACSCCAACFAVSPAWVPVYLRPHGAAAQVALPADRRPDYWP